MPFDGTPLADGDGDHGHGMLSFASLGRERAYIGIAPVRCLKFSKRTKSGLARLDLLEARSNGTPWGKLHRDGAKPRREDGQ